MAEDTLNHPKDKMDPNAKIFLYTLMGNLTFFVCTILIFKKVRYWRNDDQNQRDKQKNLKTNSMLSGKWLAMMHQSIRHHSSKKDKKTQLKDNLIKP